jgi:acetyl-CoA C-acetyltransferase
MSDREIWVISAVRTAIGTFGGTLKDVPLIDLATTVVRASLQRAGVDPEHVGHVVFGNVIPTETRDAYLSRVAAMNTGIPKETPAMNVNRLCGSGLQAIISAAQSLMLNDADVVIGGGAETMSRGPYMMPAARWGARLGDATVIDYMNGILHDPFGHFHMGITAENVAAQYGVTREMQDSLSVASQQRAARAIAESRFKNQIVSVEIPSKKGPIIFETDEHVRSSVTLEQLAKMKPVFKADGVVTAGNASGLNDGASVAAGRRRQSATTWPQALGEACIVCARRRRSCLHGHGPRPSIASCVETGWSQCGQSRCDRIKRSLRGASLRGHPGTRPRSR